MTADLFINFQYLISKDLHSEGIALCLHNQVFCYTHDIMRFLSHLSEQRDLLVKIAPALPEHGRRRVAMHHTGFNVHVHFSAGTITRVGGFDRTHSRQYRIYTSTHFYSLPSPSVTAARKYRHEDAADHDHHTLSFLLLSVVSEFLPPGASFRFWEVILEEMCLRQKEEVEADDIKCFDNSADCEEPEEKPVECETIAKPVYSSENEQPNIRNYEKDKDHPSQYPLRRHRKAVKSGL